MVNLIHQIVAWVSSFHWTNRELKLIGGSVLINGTVTTAMLKMWWTRFVAAMYGRAGRVYTRVTPQKVRWFLGDDIQLVVQKLEAAEQNVTSTTPITVDSATAASLLNSIEQDVRSKENG